MKKRIICTVCPQGCEITATFEGDKIVEFTGYGCPRGVEFARTEFTNPLRILSTSVKVEGGCYPLVSVRSDRGIPRSDLMDCMDTFVKCPSRWGLKEVV